MGSLSAVLLDSYLRNPFINLQVFYALFPCVVHNSNLSFHHVKTNEILNFLLCIFIFFSFVLSSVLKKSIEK